MAVLIAEAPRRRSHGSVRPVIEVTANGVFGWVAKAEAPTSLDGLPVRLSAAARNAVGAALALLCVVSGGILMTTFLSWWG